MKLIREAVNNVEILTEATSTGKNYFIEGIFLMGDVRNKNNRIYPSKILEAEVERYNREFIQEHRAMGELGHPDTPSIILENVSHSILSLTKQGNNYIGKAKILESTPKGKIAKALLDEKIRLGVSSRGLGSLKESNGANIVQSDFFLTTAADIVADPSAPNAFVNGILESKEWILDSGVWKPEEIKQMQTVIQKRKTISEETFLLELTKFLRKL
jgi:hypothetical protein